MNSLRICEISAVSKEVFGYYFLLFIIVIK